MDNKWPRVATFSIIGYDPRTNELGIAVQSKFLGVGAVVPWAKAGIGAIATQSFANTAFGPNGLDLLEKGFSPEEVIEKLLENDADRELRQFSVIDAKGEVAVFTGNECFHWAGHRKGEFCSAQGNILVGEETINQFVKTFEETTGPLANRLLNALDLAQTAGGDSRGKQSAALFVVQNEGGYGGYNDRKYDLRVDDHKEPIKELKRLYELHQLYFTKPDKNSLIPMEGDTLKQVQKLLIDLEFLDTDTMEDYYSDHVKKQLKSYYMKENFEERWRDDHFIDSHVLGFMKQHRRN